VGGKASGGGRHDWRQEARTSQQETGGKRPTMTPGHQPILPDATGAW
jgi:hypothetical protein